MKSHAIIPIFIPHKGCPNSCIFCNQHKITLNEKPVSQNDVAKIIEKHLVTLKSRNLTTVEAAFYGGSFTGLPIEEQSAYLEVASFYKRHGMFDKIHLSTRPDYINDSILSNLKRYGVDTIELGVQSFDDDVLERSNRGHNSSVVYESSRMIHDYGFELGLQLMVGLPGDTPEKSIYSANELVKVNPSIARIYPTIVIEDTELHNMVLAGTYTPLTLNESVSIVKTMYQIISSAGINVIRIGLRSADLVEKAGKNFHPAFRQLIESEIAKTTLDEQLNNDSRLSPLIAEMDRTSGEVAFLPCVPVTLLSNEKSFSNMIGHCKSNKIYFNTKYPLFKFSYEVDNTLADHQYIVV